MAVEFHRRSIRLRGYDYTRPGAYFVTVCTEDRQRLFGVVVNGRMALNAAGRMVQTVWNELPAHYPGVAIDASSPDNSYKMGCWPAFWRICQAKSRLRC